MPLYVFSMVFQIAGALLLLINSFTKLNIQIRRLYSNGEVLVKMEGNMCILKKERVREITNDVILNRCAFIDLFLGYLMTVFAKTPENTCEAFMWILVLTFIIMLSEFVIAYLASQVQEDMKVPATDGANGSILYADCEIH